MLGNTTSQLELLLKGYRAVLNRSTAHETKDQLAERQILRRLLIGFASVRNEWMRNQRAKAEDFNLMEVLDVAYDELRHSAMLEWLLDHSLNHHGTHAQGNLGFLLFLQELGLPLDYASAPYWVRREVVGEESRVDIEVAAHRRFIIHIENKIRSREGYNQTQREAGDLKRRAHKLGISSSSKNVHGIFLTTDGANALDSTFRPISWSRLASVLERFAQKAKPPDVRVFAAHYAKVLRHATSSTPETERSNYEQVVV